MSLSTNVANLATAVATNAKSMKTLLNGNAADLTALTTVSKSNLVAAINEIAAAVGGAGAAIVDVGTSTTSVWSSSKTDTSINTAVAALVATAPAALDTLNELAAALGDDPAFATTLATSLGLKAPLANPTFTGTVAGVTKTHVGLANVDNTTDLLKPLSTAAIAESTVAKARANHTGTQLAATVSDFSTAADARITVQKGALSGLASLDAGTKVPIGQIPTGATGVTVALGNDGRFTDARTPSNDAALAHLAGAETISGVKNFTAQPTGITKASVGLANVDNTTDLLKPLSTAETAALLLKAPVANPTFTGTVGGVTSAMVGLSSVDNTADASKPVSTAQATAIALKAPIASPTFTGTVGGVTASHVGLANVNNTSDAAKPISTAQATVNTAQTTANGTFALGSDLGNAATDFVAAFNAGLV